MTILLKKRAWNAIVKTAAWVESKNTEGSGQRWADKIYTEIERTARTKAEFALCRNQALAKFDYRCFHIHEWVVAYKVVKDQFVIYRFIYGPKLH